MARGRSRKVKRDEPLPPVENMARPTFHTILSLPNTNVARGIIVPQTVIDYYNLPPLHYMYATEPSAALFFTTPDNAIKFTDARRHLPPGTQTGVRLADALTQDAAALEFDAARDGPTMAGFSDTQLEFAIKWPGCRHTELHKTQERPRWSPARIAYEVALMVRTFYMEFLDHLNPTGPERGWNIQNDDVPFDQLYLLELRQIASCAFQPVLSFEPMWFYDEQPSSQ